MPAASGGGATEPAVVETGGFTGRLFIGVVGGNKLGMPAEPVTGGAVTSAVTPDAGVPPVPVIGTMRPPPGATVAGAQAASESAATENA
jgi:hypothetical protein